MRSMDSAWYLRLLCRDIKDYLYNLSSNPIIVEIGSYEGESTEIFAQEFPFATIYAIDPWVNGYDDKDFASNSNMIQVENNFNERTKYYKNIIKIKDFSLNVDMSNIHMVYIDGNHQYEAVKNDILHWKPRLVKNGIISGHDYTNYGHVAGVKKAVDEILKSVDKVYKDNSWFIKT